MDIKFLKKHKERFKKLGVDVVYLFGSYANGTEHPFSDIDIGVVFREPQKYKDKTTEPYLELYKVFLEVLPKEYLKKRCQARAHEFDLVFLQFASMDLRFNALKRGRAIFMASRKREADFRERTLKRYIDLSHLLKIREQAILGRI